MDQRITYSLVGAMAVALVWFVSGSSRNTSSGGGWAGFGLALKGSIVGASAGTIVWLLIFLAPPGFQYAVGGGLVIAGGVFGITSTPKSKVLGGALYGGVGVAAAATVLFVPHIFMAILIAAGAGVLTAHFNSVPPHRYAGLTAAVITGATAAGLAYTFPVPQLPWMEDYQAWLGLIRALALAAVVGAAWKLGSDNLDSGPPEQKDRIIEYRNERNDVAIVFIHGFLGSAKDTWSSLAHALMKNPDANGFDIFSFGYPTSLNLDLAWRWTADPDLPTVTKKLRTAAISSTKLKRYRRYVIIAHSMGGLVTQRALLDDEEFRNAMDLVVLFGTPSNGRSAGIGGMFKRQVDEMDPDGNFIRELRRDWNDLTNNGRLPFAFYSVAGAEDNFIPPSTSLDPFPEDQQRVVAGDHLTMVEADGPDDDVVQLVVGMLRGEDPLPWNAAQLAVERGDFQKAIDAFEPHVDDLDPHAVKRLAFAYAATDQSDKAIALLEKHSKKGGTDAMGILAGQLKRRWLVGRRDEDGKRSQGLYRKAYEMADAARDHDQGYYHAINLAFMSLLYDRSPKTAKTHASAALKHCRETEPGIWRAATEAEAQLYLGDRKSAIEHYGAVLATPGDSLSPRMARSMYKQAQSIAEALGDRALADRIDAVFQRNV